MLKPFAAVLASALIGAGLVNSVVGTRTSPRYATLEAATSDISLCAAGIITRRQNIAAQRAAEYRALPTYLRALKLGRAQCRVVETERMYRFQTGNEAPGVDSEADRASLHSSLSLLRRLTRTADQEAKTQFFARSVEAACQATPDSYR